MPRKKRNGLKDTDLSNGNGLVSNKKLRIGTWNVRSMLAPGKMEEIARELIKFKYDLAAIQEIRWKGQGEIRKKNYTLMCSGSESRTGQRGTGFIITGRVRKSILSFEPCNEEKDTA